MKNNFLEKIHEAGLKFLDPLSLNDTYATIVKEAVKLVGASYGSLTLEQEGAFKEVYSTLPIKVKRRKKGFTYKAFKEGKVIILYPKEDPKFLKIHPQFTETEIQANFNIPLLYKKKSIGVLIVNLKQKPDLNNDELGALLLFGSFASLAIKKAQLYDETRKAIETRDLFISMAAHELRTPLTSVNGYAQLLYNKLAHHPKLFTESRWAEQLVGESVRLSYLINEFLEIYRIRAGRLQHNLKQTDLNKVIVRVVADFKMAFPEQKLEYINKLNGSQINIIGDFDKLIQAFINLLDNAAKFSNNNQKIRLSLNSTRVHWVITIQDKGIGIDKDLIKELLKGKPILNKEKEGLGFGLFLTKAIITEHKGLIDIKSSKNHGTKVTVKLPKSNL